MITMTKDGKKPSISSNDITMRFLFLNRNPLNRFFCSKNPKKKEYFISLEKFEKTLENSQSIPLFI